MNVYGKGKKYCKIKKSRSLDAFDIFYEIQQLSKSVTVL